MSILKSPGTFRMLIYMCTCFLVYLFTFPNQLPFPFTFHFLDRNFPFHCRLSIWQFFDVYQFDRPARSCITRAASLVVHSDTFFRANRPARVVGPIRAFDDITITVHYLRCFWRSVSAEPKSIWLTRSPNEGASIVCPSPFSHSPAVRSSSQRARPFQASPRRSSTAWRRSGSSSARP